MKRIQRAIERYLESKGYYKVIMPEGPSPSRAEVMEAFQLIGAAPGDVIRRHMRDLCTQDKDVSFHLPPEAVVDRGKMQGSYGRTNHFLALIQKSNDKRK